MRKFIAPGVLALAATALSAQGVDINGGLNAGLSLPFGDLKDKDGAGTNRAFGGHIAGHLDFNITPHHQVRAHLTYNRFPGSSWDYSFAGISSSVETNYTAFQLGADWVYNFQNPSAGWYSVLGVSVNNVKADSDVNVAGFSASGSSTQNGRFGVRAGAGYTFNKYFSLEGTLNHISVDDHGSDGFGYTSAHWLAVSAVFRFGH